MSEATALPTVPQPLPWLSIFDDVIALVENELDEEMFLFLPVVSIDVKSL